MRAVEAAWRPDPSGLHELRYWDGSQWTDYAADQGQQVSDPMPSSMNRADALDYNERAALLMSVARRLGMNNDTEIRATIRTFIRATGLPLDPQELLRAHMRDDSIHERPWSWVLDTMAAGVERKDWITASAGYWWAIDWSQILPKFSNADMFDMPLSAIQPTYRWQIEMLGMQAAGELPPDTVVVGDETGAITAGLLATVTFEQLGIA